MSSSDHRAEMKRLEGEISISSGSRKDSLKVQYYDAERKYKAALANETKAQYEKAGWI